MKVYNRSIRYDYGDITDFRTRPNFIVKVMKKKFRHIYCVLEQALDNCVVYQAVGNLGLWGSPENSELDMNIVSHISFHISVKINLVIS